MNKLFIVWLVIMAFCLGMVFMGNKYENLPVIKLAKEFQHKTIGELPFVEAWDDGDFYEKDGEEEQERKKKETALNYKISAKYRDCVVEIQKKCGDRIVCYNKKKKRCDSRYEKDMKKHFNTVSPFTSFFIFKEPPDVDCSGGFCLGNWPMSLKGWELKEDKWYSFLI